MATDVSQPFYDKLRKHFETGVRWQRMSFTEEQKKRIERCLDAYNRFSTDPYIDLSAYIRNKWNLSYGELRNDLKVIEFIASFYEEGQRSLSTIQVRHAGRTLMKTGADTGNMKALADGASLIFKLERLDQPVSPEDMDANMAKMPIVVTTDVGRKYKNKQGRDTEEMKQIRKKWNVKQDGWQEMVEKRSGEFIPSGPPEDYEEESLDEEEGVLDEDEEISEGTEEKEY